MISSEPPPVAELGPSTMKKLGKEGMAKER